jgi:hypothetical protein
VKAIRGFLPSGLDGFALEARVVMSQGAMMTSALVLNPAQHSPRALRHLSAQDRVNQAFDRFTTDYLQAQQIYLASTGFPATGTTTAESTFKDYTTQRVNLLAQELVQALIRLPGALNRLQANQRVTPSMSTTLQAFLYRKINGNGVTPPAAPSPVAQYDNTSLLTALNGMVPPQPAAGNTIPPATVTLFTLRASDAIESARINTINAAYLMSSSTFLKHK